MADRTDEKLTRRSQPTSERVQRMLSIIPWIAAQDGPRVDEVCSHFGVERRRLLDDLQVLQFVGLPPYTPDMLTEVVIEGERVWVRLPDVFARPLQLTPNQALSLVAAGSALTTPAAAGGPLATGVAKLATLLGIEVAEAVSVQLGQGDPEVLGTLQEAVRTQDRLRLDYFTYGRDERNQREVDPYQVFSEAGAWYLYGHCHRAGEPRLFRLDRIYGAEVTGETFERDGSAESRPELFGPNPDLPRVTLALVPEARWVADQYPTDQKQMGTDGRLLVTLAVASPVWLEKLLLRLGPAAEVVETTDEALRSARSRAAQKVLARYQPS